MNQNFTDVRTLINGQIDGVDNISSIVTANKVSGAALYLLGNIPSGAGIVPSANLDRFNPQKLTASSAITEGAGTATNAFTSSTIVVVTDGALSVLLIAVVTWKNNDATGGLTLLIQDSTPTTIDNNTGANLDQAIVSEQMAAVSVVVDTRPAASSKTYRLAFSRFTAGTVTLLERSFYAITLPDPV